MMTAAPMQTASDVTTMVLGFTNLEMNMEVIRPAMKPPLYD